MACEPPDPLAGPGWPRFTPEQIEEGRRYGLELDPAKSVDFSEFIRNLIAELEAEPGPDR
ncbi:MAG: hypothetical protein K2X82_32900 [Gemmataceae bacterium]|nr:hypothetical protein [Gemmataceae bacterium]